MPNVVLFALRPETLVLCVEARVLEFWVLMWVELRLVLVGHFLWLF